MSRKRVVVACCIGLLILLAAAAGATQTSAKALNAGEGAGALVPTRTPTPTPTQTPVPIPVDRVAKGFYEVADRLGWEVEIQDCRTVDGESPRIPLEAAAGLDEPWLCVTGFVGNDPAVGASSQTYLVLAAKRLFIEGAEIRPIGPAYNTTFYVLNVDEILDESLWKPFRVTRTIFSEHAGMNGSALSDESLTTPLDGVYTYAVLWWPIQPSEVELLRNSQYINMQVPEQ